MNYLINRHTDPYFNMAFDEYCLEHKIGDGPLCYLWQNRPAVIVGANQQIHTEVDVDYLKEHDIVLARRVTGGGAVYHDWGNLNYTIVGEAKEMERDYPEYACLMQQALCELGVPATLSGRNDILVDGLKVSGFAKRVAKGRIMVHGTLMYDVDVEVLSKALTPPAVKLQTKGIASVRSRVGNLKPYLPHIADIDGMRSALLRILSRGFTDKEVCIDEKGIAEIEKLAKEKFADWHWIYGHSPQASLTQSARLKCGNVTVHLQLNKGMIANCTFEGDFLGNLPINEVEEALVGVAYEHSLLAKQLAKLNIAAYLDGVTGEELLKLII